MSRLFFHHENLEVRWESVEYKMKSIDLYPLSDEIFYEIRQIFQSSGRLIVIYRDILSFK